MTEETFYNIYNLQVTCTEMKVICKFNREDL